MQPKSMRNQLETEIINTLLPFRKDLPMEDIRAQITIILAEYEIEKRKTEVAIRDEDLNKHYLAMFLASKAAGGRTDRTLNFYKTELTRTFNNIDMHLELGSKKAGQFFTPYNICQLMARMQKFNEDITTINEPTCGAGGNIIALAEAMKQQGINYQRNFKAVCQDIDVKAVYMTYVQLTLYGIPAIVYQADTLCDPYGRNSSTGRLYTLGYMLAPRLWKKGD